MGEFLDYFKQKKNLLNLLILGVLVLGLKLGIDLAMQQQIIKSRAQADPITFVEDENVTKKTNGKWVAKNPQVKLQLVSPLGPPPSSSLVAALSLNGVNIDANRRATVKAGTPLNFTVNAKANGLDLAFGWLEVTTTDKTEPPCGGSVGGSIRAGTPWCNLAEKSLSGSSGTYTATWTPNQTGEYYVTAAMFSNYDGANQNNSNGCTSAPWCDFGGSCLAGGGCSACSNIWTHGSCGQNGYIKLNVTN